MRKIDGDKDNVEIRVKIGLIYLILRKMGLMTLMTSSSRMGKMAVNDGVKAMR